MRKRTTLAISIAVAASMLTGCSPGDTNSEEVVAATHESTAGYEYNESGVVDISLGATTTADSSAVDVDGATATITTDSSSPI